MTRFTILFSLIFSLFSTTIFAGHKVAVGVEGGLISYKSVDIAKMDEIDDESKDDYYNKSFEISPFVGIMAGDLVEIRPGVTFRNYRGGNTETTGDSITYHRETKYFSFGANVGGYFHLIREESFHLTVGPRFGWIMNGKPKEEYDSSGVIVEQSADDIYDTYKNNEFQVSAPLNLDFHIGKVFGIKLSFDLLGVNIVKEKYRYKESETEYEDKVVIFTLLGSAADEFTAGALIPTAGIFFRF